MTIRSAPKCLLVFTFLLLASCNARDEGNAVSAQLQPANQWAFMHFNVPYGNQGEVDSYYFNARVSGDLMNRIAARELESGFILLIDVIYFSESQGMYQYYEDDVSSGQILFRIEDLVHAELRKKPPEVGVRAAPTDDRQAEQQELSQELDDTNEINQEDAVLVTP